MNLADSQGTGIYGSVGHRLFWGPPPDEDNGLILDCMDTRGFGEYVKATNKATTAGVLREVAQGSVAKQSDGSWKVTDSRYLVDQDC
jgi:hypothetical protein